MSHRAINEQLMLFFTGLLTRGRQMWYIVNREQQIQPEEAIVMKYPNIYRMSYLSPAAC